MLYPPGLGKVLDADAFAANTDSLVEGSSARDHAQSHDAKYRSCVVF